MSAPTLTRVRRRSALARTTDVGVLVVVLALAQLPLVHVYGASALVPAVAGGLALGTLVALAGARWRLGVAVLAALTFVVHVVAAPALAAPTLARGGWVPTLESSRAVLTATVGVWKEVLTLDPELGAAGTLLVAPFLLSLLGSVGAVTAALRVIPRRAAAWAVLVPVVVLGVSLLLATATPFQPVPAGVGFTLLLLSWAAWRRGRLARRRLVSVGVLAAVVAGAGATAGPWLADQRPRFVLRDELVPPFDPSQQVSPLSGFRTFVKDWADTELLTVSGLPAGTPVRLATMDAYDGIVWDVAGADQAEGSGRFRRVGETIATTVRGTPATVELEVHALPMVWLPTVGYAESFTFARGGDAGGLAADLRYNDATGAAVLVDGVPAGTRWTTEVVVPAVPDDDELAQAADGPSVLPELDGVPDAVRVYAAQTAGTATSPGLVALSLEAGLAERGWFSHGLVDQGDYPSLSGHGAGRITELLTGELMVGDGEQYASAMALMARVMGLPARVVLGFWPDGEPDGETGAATDTGTLTFTGDDIDAWVEVELAGYGWVPFRPTPDETRTPREDTPRSEAEPEPQVRQPPPPPQDPVTLPDDDTEQPTTEETEDADRSGDTLRTVLLVAAAVGVPLVLLVGPPLLVVAAKRRRRRRRRSAPDAVARVVGGWDELLDEARDLRHPPPPAATRREVAVALAGAFAVRRDGAEPPATGRRSNPVGGPVAGLAASADAVVFGAGSPTPAQVEAYWAQVDVAVRAMRTAVPRGRRWWSRWSVRSLRSRRRATGAGRRPVERRTRRRTLG